MSNRVWENILIPIVLRILSGDITVGDLFRSDREDTYIKDRNLERFVLQEVNKRLGVNGKVTTDAYGNILEDEYCEALETILNEMKERSPKELETILKEILSLYVKLGLIEADARALYRTIKLNSDRRRKSTGPKSPYYKSPEEREKERRERKPKEKVRAV